MVTRVGGGVTISDSATASSYSTTSNYTVGSGADRVLLIWLHGYLNSISDPAGATAVIHNGQPATKLAFSPVPQTSRNWLECWYIVNPTTGAGGTSVTLPAAQRAFGASVEEFIGVDQTVPVHSAYIGAFSATATSAGMSLTTHAAGAGLSAAVSVESDAGTFSATGATVVDTILTGTTGFSDVSGCVAWQPMPTVGTQPVTLSWSTSKNFAAAMVELQAASGGGGITGTMAASETGADAASMVGAVSVSGSLGATEAGSDAMAGAGDVAVSGALAASEAGADAFSATGTVTSGGVVGSMAAAETGADIAAMAGGVTVAGAMSAGESGTDILAGAGAVIVAGAMAAVEAGSDAFAAVGTVVSAGEIVGSMVVAETGSDAASGAGSVVVGGVFVAAEFGVDIMAAIGGITITGGMIATESGIDLFSAAGTVSGGSGPSSRFAYPGAAANGGRIEQYRSGG